MLRRLGYIHLPKSAGTYITNTISDYYNLNKISIHQVVVRGREDLNGEHDRERSDHQLIVLDEKKPFTSLVILERPFYGGHLSLQQMSFLGNRTIFTVLTNPFHRALSLYRMARVKNEMNKDLISWLEDYRYSVQRQVLGRTEGKEIMESLKEVDCRIMYEAFDRIYCVSDPNQALAFLNRDFDLRIPLGNKPVNTYKQLMKTFGNLSEETYNTERLLEALINATEVERRLIEIVEQESPKNSKLEVSIKPDEILKIVNSKNFISLV